MKHIERAIAALMVLGALYIAGHVVAACRRGSFRFARYAHASEVRR